MLTVKKKNVHGRFSVKIGLTTKQSGRKPAMDIANCIENKGKAISET